MTTTLEHRKRVLAFQEQQADLLDWEGEEPLARRKDPLTSHEAADNAKDFASRQHAQILRVMTKACRSMASQEIDHQLGWPTHRRMVELERAGKVEISPDDYHTNESGRRARRYRLRSQP